MPGFCDDTVGPHYLICETLTLQTSYLIWITSELRFVLSEHSLPLAKEEGSFYLPNHFPKGERVRRRGNSLTLQDEHKSLTP